MAKVVYTGVSNKARKCKALYVGVNNKARKVKKGYVGVNNKARLFYSSDVIYTWKRYNVKSTTTTTWSATNNNTSIYAHVVKNTSKYIHKINMDNDAAITASYQCNTTDLINCLNNSLDGKYLAIASYERDTSASSSKTIYQLNGLGRTANIKVNGTVLFKVGSGQVLYNSNLYAYNISLYTLTSTSNTTYSCGTYIDTVTAANNPNAYPTNGKSGNYWYIKQ